MEGGVAKIYLVLAIPNFANLGSSSRYPESGYPTAIPLFAGYIRMRSKCHPQLAKTSFEGKKIDLTAHVFVFVFHVYKSSTIGSRNEGFPLNFLEDDLTHTVYETKKKLTPAP